MGRCICRCNCWRWQDQDMDGLCEFCWLAWCQGEENHGFVADRSYMGTYGLKGVWTTWIMAHAPHLLRDRPGEFQQREYAPRCPRIVGVGHTCGQLMVRRLGAWKCYHHDPPETVKEGNRLPRSPRIAVLEIAE